MTRRKIPLLKNLPLKVLPNLRLAHLVQAEPVVLAEQAVEPEPE